MREGVCPNSRVDLRRFFYPTPIKFGVDIAEWSMLNANVLDFRYVFALSNYGLFATWTEKRCKFWGFRPPFVLGPFEEIGIAKVLLGTKPRSVGKFRGCRFYDV